MNLIKKPLPMNGILFKSLRLSGLGCTVRDQRTKLPHEPNHLFSKTA